MSPEEGQKAVSIGCSQGDREVADIDWAVDQREKGTGSVGARGDVGSLDLVREGLGPRTDY